MNEIREFENSLEISLMCSGRFGTALENLIFNYCEDFRVIVHFLLF